MTTITREYFRENPFVSQSISASDALTRLYRKLADAASPAASSIPSHALANLGQIAKECSTPGWDGYGAKPITEATIRRAQAFVEGLPSWMPVPDIVPEADGDVAVEWYIQADKTFSISIADRGPLQFAGRFGPEDEEHGIKAFNNVTVSEDVLRLIGKLFRETTGRRAA